MVLELSTTEHDNMSLAGQVPWTRFKILAALIPFWGQKASEKSKGGEFALP